MKTFKVTYYNVEMEIDSVITYNRMDGTIISHMKANKCPFIQVLKEDGDVCRNVTELFYCFYSEEIKSAYEDIFQ